MTDTVTVFTSTYYVLHATHASISCRSAGTVVRKDPYDVQFYAFERKTSCNVIPETRFLISKLNFCLMIVAVIA
jgi:hypothetical protein